MWIGSGKWPPLTLTLSPLREERNGERELSRAPCAGVRCCARNVQRAPPLPIALAMGRGLG
jgi:hypothetical protein